MQTKIDAKIDGDEIKVHADFIEEDKIIHEVNFAFPLETTEEEIRSEIEKSKNLYISEKEKEVEQKELDEKYKSANEVIINLNKKDERK